MKIRKEEIKQLLFKCHDYLPRKFQVNSQLLELSDLIKGIGYNTGKYNNDNFRFFLCCYFTVLKRILLCTMS